METEKGKCFICHRTTETEIHHIFNGHGYRDKSDSDSLVVHVCRRCHDEIHRNAALRLELKRLGQQEYENRIGSRDEFRKRYGKSYL